MRNILIVAPYFYPEGGGLELYAYKIANYLSRKNRIVVLCSTKKESKTENLNPNLKIVREKPNLFVSNTPINFRLKATIESIVKEYDIQIINAHTPVPFYADVACSIAIKRRIPFILHYHSGSLYKNRTLLDLMAFFYENLFEKRLFSYAKKIILASHYNLNRKASKYKDKTAVITPSVDRNLFKKIDNERRKEILFVGQLNISHKWKGLENLIRAFKQLENHKDYNLLIIGGGDYIEYYRKLAKRLGLENLTRFLKKLSQEEIVRYYQRCSFVVIPSISNVEATPMVILESMACGTPVIGGDVGGIPYIINENKNGIIVNARDIRKLSGAMKNLIENRRLYDELSRNCLQNIHKYYEEESFKRHEKIFEDIDIK